MNSFRNSAIREFRWNEKGWIYKSLPTAVPLAGVGILFKIYSFSLSNSTPLPSPLPSPSSSLEYHPLLPIIPLSLSATCINPNFQKHILLQNPKCTLKHPSSTSSSSILLLPSQILLRKHWRVIKGYSIWRILHCPSKPLKISTLLRPQGDEDKRRFEERQ